MCREPPVDFSMRILAGNRRGFEASAPWPTRSPTLYFVGAEGKADFISPKLVRLIGLAEEISPNILSRASLNIFVDVCLHGETWLLSLKHLQSCDTLISLVPDLLHVLVIVVHRIEKFVHSIESPNHYIGVFFHIR